MVYNDGQADGDEKQSKKARRVTRKSGTGTLRLIALFKFCKAAILLLVLAVSWRFIHHNPAQTVLHWALRLHVDPDNHYVHALLAKLLNVNERQLALFSAGTVLYATVFMVEGLGLWLARAWAEYLTIVTTAGLLPVELYELGKHATLTQWVVLVINVGIVLYLARHLWRRRRREPDAEQSLL